jgi:hypothetical protein
MGQCTQDAGGAEPELTPLQLCSQPASHGCLLRRGRVRRAGGRGLAAACWPPASLPTRPDDGSPATPDRQALH